MRRLGLFSGTVFAIGLLAGLVYAAVGLAHADAETAAAAVSRPVPAASASFQIEVTARVQGSRLLVVDGRGNITAIHSNTPDSGAPVHARRGGLEGEPLQVTPDLMARYRSLEPSINWSRLGQVYTRR